MNSFMNFDNISIVNIRCVIDYLVSLLKKYEVPPIMVGVGNHDIMIDKIGYEIAKKCIYHYDIPIIVYGVENAIIPQNIDTYLSYFSHISAPKIVIDSAIGSTLGRVTITSGPTTVSCLSSPKAFGDISILITTVTKDKNISSLDIINISDLMSYAISCAVQEYIEEKNNRCAQ